MKKVLTFVCAVSLAISAFAQPADRSDRTGDREAMKPKLFPLNPEGSAAATAMVDETWEETRNTVDTPKLHAIDEALTKAPNAVNLTYHGGDVINTAHLVC